MLSLFFQWISRFINARRRIVQPMIDQSNRAGKLNINENEMIDERLSSCSTNVVIKRNNHLKHIRGLSQNEKKFHRRKNLLNPSSTARESSRRTSLSYSTKGKSNVRLLD